MMGRDDPRHNLRLTEGLKKRLQHAAIDGGRSLNAEILDRLERSFAPDPVTHFTELLRPLTLLDETDRAAAADHLAKAAAILGGIDGDER